MSKQREIVVQVHDAVVRGWIDHCICNNRTEAKEAAKSIIGKARIIERVTTETELWRKP